MFINQQIKSVIFRQYESSQHGSTPQQCAGFKRCCLSSALDETNVDMLWICVEKNGNVRSWCEEDENTDCADGKSDAEWYR
jgi:hypothetical protein